MKAGQRLDEVPQTLVEMVTTDFRQAQKVFPLPDPNDHPDAGGESHNHGVRNELNECAKFSDAEQQ
ncbi:hypothetical protein D3C76_1593200 [compost metagenome]